MESNNRINVYGYLYNNTPEGIVALSQQVYDERTGVSQGALNESIPVGFNGFVDVSAPHILNTVVPESVGISGIYYNTRSNTFIALGDDNNYYSDWETKSLYMEDNFNALTNKIFYNGAEIYSVNHVYDETTQQEKNIIVQVGEAQAAEVNERLAELESDSVSKITINGQELTPDENGNVSITVDSSLDSNSTNPVQNKVVKGELDKTAKFHTQNDVKVIDSEYKVTSDNVVDPVTGANLRDSIQDIIEEMGQGGGSDHTMYTYPKFEIDPETMILYMIVTSNSDRDIITLGEDGYLYYNVQIEE